MAGFTQQSFNGVNRADAEAAFRVFARTAGRQRGYEVDVTVKMYKDAAELQTDLAVGAINLLIVDSWTYLDLEPAVRIEPAYVSSVGGEAFRQQVLLTRRDSGVAALADLRGRKLTVQSASNSNLGLYWLQALCAEQVAAAPESFFGSIEYLAKPSQVVHPVFFGRKDACLVDSTGFALLTEMNPQLGRDLRVVASSEPIVDTLICLSEMGWSSPEFRNAVHLALGELHLEPAGQQVLTLFRSGPLLPFQAEHLDSVRKLHTRTSVLRAAMPAANVTGNENEPGGSTRP